MGTGIENYRAEGIEPYAVSPQNEPFFVQGVQQLLVQAGVVSRNADRRHVHPQS